MDEWLIVVQYKVNYLAAISMQEVNMLHFEEMIIMSALY